MHLVDRPALAPGTCIVNLSSEDPGGFVDLGDRAIVDPRLYVSRQAVIDLGRYFGLPAPEAHTELVARVTELEAANEALLDENRALNRDVEAAEWTLERKFQAKPQGKPGRPKKVAV